MIDSILNNFGLQSSNDFSNFRPVSIPTPEPKRTSGTIIDIIDAKEEIKERNKVHILIVNHNLYDKMCQTIRKIMLQKADFDLTIFDNNSDDLFMKEYYKDLKKLWNRPNCELNILYNSVNAPLNHVWQWFKDHTTAPYLAILNNDLKICDNLISDAIEIFEQEPTCGIIFHPTNRPEFKRQDTLVYEVADKCYSQGHDYIIRREAWVDIPKELLIWCGDTWLCTRLYKHGWKQIYDMSSPVIHYANSTSENVITEISPLLQQDLDNYNSRYAYIPFDGNEHTPYCHRYCESDYVLEEV